jgi:pimeloyl-ACP methyl ester carboxylesterase
VATVERCGDIEIHWEAQGSGPVVVIVHQLLWSYPRVYADLIDELARDRMVVTFDPRGCGSSTPRGPYDTETDAGDLEAVVEAAGGAAVALAVGYGYNLAVRVASRRPDLISALVTVQPAAAALLPRHELRGTEVIAASDSVMDMLMQMLNTDPRAALRTVLAATNPDLDEERLRERLDRVADYIAPDAGRERAAAWVADDPSEHAIALGDRLSIVHSGAEALFEGALAARVGELYPEARIEQIEGGPISRPAVIAERIRQASG